MNLIYVIDIINYAYPEGLNDIVVNILHMVLEVAPVFYPHDKSEVEPQLLLKVFSVVLSTNWIHICIQTV